MRSNASTADDNNKGIAQLCKSGVCEEYSVPGKLLKDEICNLVRPWKASHDLLPLIIPSS